MPSLIDLASIKYRNFGVPKMLTLRRVIIVNKGMGRVGLSFFFLRWSTLSSLHVCGAQTFPENSGDKQVQNTQGHEWQHSLGKMEY